MKRIVLCVFTLILYLLIACTMLSHKIEQEMATLVRIDVRTAAGSLSPTSQSMDVLFYDSEGAHLYEVVDGTGWNSGLRIHEIPTDVWSIGYSIAPYVEIPGGSDYRFVTSASRQPPDGKPAEIVEKIETAPDQYLCLFSDGIPEEITIPQGASITAKSGTAVLLNMESAEYPFMEHTAKGLSSVTSTADRIFSITEAELFIDELPNTALVLVALVFGVVFLIFSFYLSFRADRSTLLLSLNIVLTMASLCLLFFALDKIDFPASMLPVENIFDMNNYKETLSLIFDTLRELQVTQLLDAWDSAVLKSLAISIGGMLIIASLITTELCAPILKRKFHLRKTS